METASKIKTRNSDLRNQNDFPCICFNKATKKKKARAILSPFYVVNMFLKKNPDHNAYIIKYLHFPMALCMQRHMSLMYDNTRNQFLPERRTVI